VSTTESTEEQTSLQDFLKLYEKVRGSHSASYATWLSQNGLNPTSDYDEALTDANRVYDRALSGYGSRAEQLAQAGLSGSGYSDYLTGQAYATLQTARQNALDSLQENIRKNASSYASYLESQGQSTKSMLGTLQNKGITDYDTAYAYALSGGLDEASATLTATLISQMKNKASNSATVKQRVTILNRLVELNLPRDAAYSYAISCGVGEEIASELADAATEALNQKNQSYLPTY
jgi:hypothetical protein